MITMILNHSRASILTRLCSNSPHVKVVHDTFSVRQNSGGQISELKEIVAHKIAKHSEKVKDFRRTHGDKKVSQVTVDMIYGGMRGVKALVTETSHLDPEEGIRFRNYSIPECRKLLPKASGGEEPLPEGLFWLLLTGDIPTKAQVESVSKFWAAHAEIPSHVVTILNNFPSHLHPMSQFAAAIAACDTESLFAKAYSEGIHRNRHWEYAFDDSMRLIARLPTIAAMIYRNLYRESSPIGPVDPDKDWSANFVNMLGFNNEKFVELMRLYLTILSDHEGGNVSAHTVHLVGSALSDPYLSFSAGVCGLAGPLHGLANQEVLVFIERMMKELGDNLSNDKIADFVHRTLKSGQVIPGFGHAVLRKTDPRYIVQREFALKHFPNDPMFKLSSQLYEIVPPILSATGKVKNPWPNGDSLSGVCFNHYNLKEVDFHTLIVAVSRSLGVLASYILDRGSLFPIERLSGLPLESLMKTVN